MTRDAWARVEEILARSLVLPAEERPDFLDRACTDDPDVRREVESLLAESTEEPDFLDRTPGWPADQEADDEASPPLPERIGPYRIVGSLGRGGMGQVYLAEREAEDFRHRVALKVVRRGLDTEDVIRRFRTERQILANLRHPNIAALSDVGATEEGLPYFVMEHVDGVPILRYCDERGLTLVERLRLFRTVCSAVDHAHRSLVVHRDIKPANILVTSGGAPKLLDFGTAKILDADGDRSGHTRPETRLLTPAYAAPEQILGLPITTACDVHALGVLLYELLTGTHPFRKEGESRGETERRVLESDPVPPSVAVGATRPHLRRALAGDLDTVVLTAVRREPGERYASVLALSEDVGRHLAGHTVSARRPTLTYRAGKLVTRRPLAVATAAAFILLLGGSTAMTLRQNGRIREQSARVSRERDKALQAQAFLLEMFSATGPDEPTGDTVTARELLDRRASNLEGAYPDLETRAEMMAVLAEGYDKLGVLDRAEPLARSALDLRRGLPTPQEADVAASLDVLGWILHERGDEAEAERVLRESVALGRKAFPEEGDPRLARALNDLGVVREAAGDYGEAAGLYRESLSMRRRFLGEAHVGVPTTMSNLAVVLYRMGDLDGAVDMSRQALARFRKILGPDHQRTLIVQSNLAAMESTRGDHAAAAREHRELLERRKAALRAPPPLGRAEHDAARQRARPARADPGGGVPAPGGPRHPHRAVRAQTRERGRDVARARRRRGAHRPSGGCARPLPASRDHPRGALRSGAPGRRDAVGPRGVGRGRARRPGRGAGGLREGGARLDGGGGGGPSPHDLDPALPGRSPDPTRRGAPRPWPTSMRWRPRWGRAASPSIRACDGGSTRREPFFRRAGRGRLRAATDVVACPGHRRRSCEIDSTRHSSTLTAPAGS